MITWAFKANIRAFGYLSAAQAKKPWNQVAKRGAPGMLKMREYEPLVCHLLESQTWQLYYLVHRPFRIVVLFYRKPSAF